MRTGDLEEIRLRGKHNATAEYRFELLGRLDDENDRVRYTEEYLSSIIAEFQDIKLGVFSRSPRSYVETLLGWAYPDIEWDIIIAYEDVTKTKPYGEGVRRAMDDLDIDALNSVVLVGDSDADVRSAYNGGVISILDKGAWPYKYERQHWNALSLVPDVIIHKPSELIAVLADYSRHLPDLESALASEGSYNSVRFDKTNLFIPSSIGGDKTAYPVHSLGRHFSGYECLSEREKWHDLTHSIHDNKDSKVFPVAWVKSIRSFIRHNYPILPFGGNLIVTVIPPRPGRDHRLMYLLNQLSLEIDASKYKGRIQFIPDLLSYKEGVVSNSRGHLSRDDRFINIRDHLYVSRPELIEDSSDVLVLDDVVTTGSTLIYSKLYIENAANCMVTCLALAKNVSKVV